MSETTTFNTTYTDLYDSDSNQSIEIPSIPLVSSNILIDTKNDCTSEHNGKKSATRSHRVTTIQEYTQLVISSMKKRKRMNTTEVAKSILGFVHPKTNKLTVNIRRRVGDALSVLTAINLVEKNTNGYLWIGENNHIEEVSRMCNEIEELKNKLLFKQQQLKSLQQKELELRKKSIQFSKLSDVESSPLSNSTVLTQPYETDSFFDSDHTDIIETESSTTVHFNNGFDDDFFCPSLTDYSFPRLPSLSLPGIEMGDISELTTAN